MNSLKNYSGNHSGVADVALYSGPVPAWLMTRMTALAFAITEAIILEHGQAEFLRRLSNPFWFQSFGAVLGMDWNSSGVATSVMSALKRSLNPHSKELGLYVCGGKGKHSLQTPHELLAVGEKTGLDGAYLGRCSKLSAKVDNTAVQDGFQLYLHSFVVSAGGEWAVVQQGMKTATGMARRYHWHSPDVQSFVEEPHAAVCGTSQGSILNLVAKEARPAQVGIMSIAQEQPDVMLKEISSVVPHLVMPSHREIRANNVDLKRLGAILWLAHEQQPGNFEELLLLQGLGPRTLQSLTLVSEVIHGTPSRFTDPARFSFAHGGKGGRPFPVPVAVYDETIATLKASVEKAKLGLTEKQNALKKLTHIAQKAEENFTPGDFFDDVLEKEKADSWKYGGRSAGGYAQRPQPEQLGLF
jgi:uncharacterized protein